MSKHAVHARLRRRTGLSMPAMLAIGGGLILLGYFITRIFAAGPASMYFSPSSGSYNAGTNLAVQIWVNTAGQTVNAVEADFSYPASQLQYASADFTGSAFGVAGPQTGGGGNVTIARGNITPMTGTVLVGTINFTVLSSAGAASLTFAGSSAIVESVGNTNIMGSSPSATYTVVVPGGGTPTPAPTAPPTQAPTPAPGGGGSNSTPTPSPYKSTKSHPTAAPVAAAGTPTPIQTAPPEQTNGAVATPAPMLGGANSLVAAANSLLGTHLTAKAAAGATIPVLLVLGVAGWLLWRHGHSSSVDTNPSHQVPAVTFNDAPGEQPSPPQVSGAPPVVGGAPPQTFMPSDQGANAVVDSATSTGADAPTGPDVGGGNGPGNA